MRFGAEQREAALEWREKSLTVYLEHASHEILFLYISIYFLLFNFVICTTLLK